MTTLINYGYLTLPKELNAVNAPHIMKDFVSMPPMANVLSGDVNVGPWSSCNDEIISDVVQGGSVLSKWIPTKVVDYINDVQNHLSFVIPDGWTGAQSYTEFLQALGTPSVCDFGPATDWSGFSYTHKGGRAGFKTETFRQDHWQRGGFCEKQPTRRIRGPLSSVPITNDADWAVARLGIQFENHLNYNLIHGDSATIPYTWDGILSVIQTGWVQAHTTLGTAVFSDPISENGIGLTAAGVLSRIRDMFRKIRNRAAARGILISANDIALVMSSAHWTVLSEEAALNLMNIPMNGLDPAVSVTISADGYENRLEKLKSGFYGFGYLPVDGFALPVIVEDLLGTNYVTDTNEPAVIGDILLLTRFLGADTLLEDVRQDFNAFRGHPAGNGTETLMQNGTVRTGWVSEANSCFYFYMETEGRFSCYGQPYQGRLNNVALVTSSANQIEHAAPTGRNWYIFNGNGSAGDGVAKVTGIGQ